MITRNELIIEMMPFSEELIQWCKKHLDFPRALKIIYPERFISLGAICTSYSDYNLNDEVIGVYSYAYRLNNPIFKQDFIVNKSKLNKIFILYTRYPNSKSKYIKDINEFYNTYGKNHQYVNSHHLTLEELPQTLIHRGIQAIKRADILKKTGIRKLSQEELLTFYKDLKKQKRNKWFNKIKI